MSGEHFCKCSLSSVQIPPWAELEERLTNYMLQFNETVRGAGMDLVFFKDAMVHLMKVGTLQLCIFKLIL